MYGKYKFRRTAVLLLIIFICLSYADVFANDQTTHFKNGKYISVSVGSGDSVWSIATHYTNNKDDIREFIYTIRKINGLNKNAEIYPGQILKIPVQV